MPVAAGTDGVVVVGVLTVGAITLVEPLVVMPLRDPMIVPERDSSVPPDSEAVDEPASEVVGEPDSEVVGELASEVVGELERGVVLERDSICWRYIINNDEWDDPPVVPVDVVPVAVVPHPGVDVVGSVGVDPGRSREDPVEYLDSRSELVVRSGVGAATTVVAVHSGSGVPLAAESSVGLAATIATYGAGHVFGDDFHCSGVRPEQTWAVAA